MRMQRIFVALLAILCLAFQVPGLEFEEKARSEPLVEVSEGILYKHLTLSEPRPLNIFIARIDLENTSMHIEGTPRDELWGQPMPDYPSLTVRTRRVTTTQFIKDRRAEGHPVQLAINACAWSPWTAPYNHKYATGMGLVVTNGVLVSEANSNPSLVIYNDGRAVIEDSPGSVDLAKISFALGGFAGNRLVKDGIPQAFGNDCHPRTCIGLSASGRFLYILAVDGRNKGNSEGATLTELGQWLHIIGAENGINLDGGGSTTFAIWNNDTNKPEKLNLMTCGEYCRPVGCSIGFWSEAHP